MTAHLEHAVIGAVLAAEGQVMASNAAALMEQAGLRATDFEDLRSRAVWPIIERLVQNRRPVSASTVYAYGKTIKTFSQGDFVWLQQLEDTSMMDRLRFAEIVEGMRIVARKKSLTTGIAEAMELLARHDSDLATIAGRLDSLVRDVLTMVTDDGTGEDDVMEIGDEWDRREAGEATTFLPTGITAIDESIGGYVRNLNMIVGQPSEGKSAFMASSIEAILDAGHVVGLFGLEDGTKWLARRLIARDMGLQLRDVGNKPRDFAMQEKWTEVGARMALKLRRLICYRHAGISVDELLRRATSWKANRKIAALFIDHGGEVDHTTSKHDEHRLAVAESYRRFRDWAINNQCPVIAIAHTARGNEDQEERPPKPREVAESAYIERRARLMLGVWSKADDGEDFMRVSVIKISEGKRNVTFKVPKHTTAALVHREGAEIVDLFGERMAAAKAAKAKKEAERAEARERVAAERAAAKNAKAQAKVQSGLQLNDERRNA